MPIVIKMRVPTKDEATEALKKAMKQLEGLVKVEITEEEEETPKPSETGTPTQPDTGTGEQK